MPYQAVHFGAGNIGRGFLGQMYRENDYEIIFLDARDNLIKNLKKATSYKINQVDKDGKQVKSVSKFRALHCDKERKQAIEAIARADIFTCSVGPRRLKDVGPILEEGIKLRDPVAKPQPLAVIACENDQNATDHLRKYVKLKGTPTQIAKKVEFANCAIDRIVPTQPEGCGLDITIERYFDWTIECRPFRGERPQIKGINWVGRLDPYLERKLFTVNTGHASIAYLGWANDVPTIHEALEVGHIRKAVENALLETANYLQKVYKFTPEEQQEYIRKTIERFKNPALNDSCIRVARDPMRKLSQNERLMKPARWLAENNQSFQALLVPIQQGFRFQNIPKDDTSAKLGKYMAANPPDDVVTYITRLTPEHPLFDPLVEVVKKAQGSEPGDAGPSGNSALPGRKAHNYTGPASARGMSSRGPVSHGLRLGTAPIMTPRPFGGSIGRTAVRQPIRQPMRVAAQQGHPQALPIRKPNARPGAQAGPSRMAGAKLF